MSYFLCGPHRGTISEYEKVCKRFNNLDDAFNYLISCFDGAFIKDNLSLHFAMSSTDFCRFNILTNRFYDDNLILRFGHACCVGHLDVFYGL